MILLNVFIFAFVGTLSASHICSPGPADVMFVISSNSSFTKATFDQKLKVVEKFAESVTIGHDDVRVGLITEYDYADLEFLMDDHLDKQELSLAILFTYFAVGSPSFGCGLQYINDRGMDTELGGRPGVPDIVVFLTDGVPDEYTLAQTEAEKLSKSGVTVIAAAGGTIKTYDLIKLASGCHYITEAADFSLAADLAFPLVNLTCDAIDGVPVDECECQLSADITFLLDASALQGKSNFTIQKDFAQIIASELNVAVNETRVAALTYANFKHPQFDLLTHKDKTETMLAIQFLPYQGTNGRNVEDGLSFIEANITSLGGRDSAEKIVIVTSTGPLSSPSEAKATAIRLKNEGIMVLSIGVGSADQQEVASLATNSDYVRHYATFTDLLSDAQSLVDLLCYKKIHITTAAPIVTTQIPLVTTQVPVVTTTSPTTPGSILVYCSFNPCYNGGLCVVIGDMYECRCAPGYTGITCADSISTTHSSAIASTTIGAVNIQDLVTTADIHNGSCPDFNSTYWPCGEAEVIFMMENGRLDVGHFLNHQGDYFNHLIDEYRMGPQNIRVGVVVYNDTVNEAIQLADYENDKDGLKARIEQLENDVKPSGEPNFTKALNFVRQNTFVRARPNVPKVIVSVVHQMNNYQRDAVIQAGQILKDDCVFLHVRDIRSSQENILKQTAYEPTSPFYEWHKSFSGLEISGHDYDVQCPVP